MGFSKRLKLLRKNADVTQDDWHNISRYPAPPLQDTRRKTDSQTMTNYI